MPDTSEARARETIVKLSTSAGWTVQSRTEVNVNAARGIAVREFPLKRGCGEADYLLYLDGSRAGVVEAKKEGDTLSGFELQTEKYSVGLPDELKPHCRQDASDEPASVLLERIRAFRSTGNPPGGTATPGCAPEVGSSPGTLAPSVSIRKTAKSAGKQKRTARSGCATKTP